MIPEMYGYKNVKWLKGIDLVRQAEARLLGAARLRPRRLGRPLERVRRVKPATVRRFSRTERTLHWANARRSSSSCSRSGLVLYLPSLAVAVGRRPLVQSVHFWSGIAWVARARADRPGRRPARARCAPRARSTASTATTSRWLTGRKPAPQGRFNAGQKLNTALTAAFTRPLPRLRAAALVRRARHAASASRARSSCTTA